jgi:hypothetical protein
MSTIPCNLKCKPLQPARSLNLNLIRTAERCATDASTLIAIPRLYRTICSEAWRSRYDADGLWHAHDHLDLSCLRGAAGYDRAARALPVMVPAKLAKMQLGDSQMRSVLALGLLIVLCAAANAAERGHHSKSRHVIVRPTQGVTSSFGMIPNYAVPGSARIYRDDTAPGGVRTYHDDPPAYNDPSKFGGA